jgi:hypothetical protein
MFQSTTKKNKQVFLSQKFLSFELKKTTFCPKTQFIMADKRRSNNKSSKQCFYCGEVYSSVRKHQSGCAFKDDNIKSKLGPLKCVQNMINSKELACLFVLMPICGLATSLVQIYYHLLKSIYPNFVVLTVPFRGTLVRTFNHMMLSEWYTKLTNCKLFLFVLNVDRSLENSQIDQYIDDINSYDDVKEPFCLVFDNWCQVKTKDEIIKAAHLGGGGGHFLDWEYSRILIGNEFLTKLNDIKSMLFGLELLDNSKRIYSIGPTYFVRSNQSIFQENKDVEPSSKKQKLMFCPSDESVLDDNMLCKICETNHALKKSLSSCTFCAQLFLSTNLSRHENVCPYSFVKCRYPSQILLLISLGLDGEIRSNLFGQFMNVVTSFDQNNDVSICRIHLNNLGELNKMIQQSKVNVLSKNNDAKVSVFVFCNFTDAMIVSGQQLINNSIIPQLSSVNLSIRIQTTEINRTLFTGFSLSSGYNVSVVTSNFRYLQIMQVYHHLVANTDDGVRLIKIMQKKLGIVPNITIIPNFREWYLNNSSLLHTMVLNFQTMNDLFTEAGYRVVNDREKQIDYLDSVMKSFDVRANEEGNFKLPKNFGEILFKTSPFFEKDLLVSYNAQKKVSDLLSKILSLDPEITESDENDEEYDVDKMNLFCEHVLTVWDEEKLINLLKTENQ